MLKQQSKTGKQPYIYVNDASFETGLGTSILKNISISVHDEQTGLVGNNGVGKTTLLKLLVGELKEASGLVMRNGVIAYLPQDLYPELEKTIAETLVHRVSKVGADSLPKG